MQTGSYVHFFLYSPDECGGHVPTNSTEVVYVCIFVIQISGYDHYNPGKIPDTP